MGPLAVAKNNGNELDLIYSFPLLFHHGCLLSGGPNRNQSTVEHISVRFLGAPNSLRRGSNGIVLQSEQLVSLFLLGLRKVKENLTFGTAVCLPLTLAISKRLPLEDIISGLTEAP